MSACEQWLRWQQALQPLAEMQAQGLEPKLISYVAAMSACAQCLQWQQALGPPAKLQVQGLEPTLIRYSAAMSVCKRDLQWQQAFSFWQGRKPKDWSQGSSATVPQ